MTTSVIVAGARTPIGKFNGSLKGFSGTDLGAIAIKAALEKAHVPASLADYVIMGQVLTAGAGQMPARQSAVGAGIGWDVPALSINKMCLSGIDAIALAADLIGRHLAPTSDVARGAVARLEAMLAGKPARPTPDEARRLLDEYDRATRHSYVTGGPEHLRAARAALLCALGVEA